MYQKSIRRDKLEGAFKTILVEMQPSATLIEIAKKMFESAWNQRLTQTKQIVSQFKQDIANIEKQTTQFLERIVSTENPKVISAYEDKITQLEK